MDTTELRANGGSYIGARECRTSYLSNKDSTELRAKRGDSTAADETKKSNDENQKFKTIPTKTISVQTKKENEQTRTKKLDNSDENTSPIRYQNILVVSQTPTSPTPNTSGTMKTPLNIPGEISENIDKFVMQTSSANPDISKTPKQMENITKTVMEEPISQSGKLMPKFASKTNDSVNHDMPETSSKNSDISKDMRKIMDKTTSKAKNSSPLGLKKETAPMTSKSDSNTKTFPKSPHNSAICSPEKNASKPLVSIAKSSQTLADRNAARSFIMSYKIPKLKKPTENGTQKNAAESPGSDKAHKMQNYLATLQNILNNDVVPQTWNVICDNKANPSPQTSMENRFSNKGDLTITKSRRKSMYVDVADSRSLLKPSHDEVCKISDPIPLENQAEKPAKTIKSRRKSRVIEIFDSQHPETSNSSNSSISPICQNEEALEERTKPSCETNSIIKPKNPRRKSMCDSSSGKDENQEIPTKSLATQCVEKTKEVVGTKDRQGKEDNGIKSEKKYLVARRKSMFAEGNESTSSISESATNYEDTTGSQYDENPLQIIGNKSSPGSEGNGIESAKTSLIARRKSMFAEANESKSSISESTKYNDEATALESQTQNLDSTDNNLRSKKPLKLRRKSVVVEVHNLENSSSTSLDLHNEGIPNRGEDELSMRLTEDHNKTQNSVDKKPLKSRRKSMFVDREDLKSSQGQQLEKETNKSFVENMEKGKSDTMENKPLGQEKAYSKSPTLKEKPIAVESPRAQGQSTMETAVETKSEKKPLKARRRSLYTEILREEEEGETLESKQGGKSLMKTEGKDKEAPQSLANDNLKAKPLKSRRKSMYAEVGDFMAEERTCKPQDNELDDTTSQGKNYKPEAADILKTSEAKGKRRKSIYVEESITKEDAASNNLEIDAASSQSTLDKPEAAGILKSSNAKGKRRKSMYVEEPITKEGIDSNNLKIDAASSQATLDKPTAAEILKSSNTKGKRRRSMYVEEPIAKGDTDSNNLEKDKKKITKSRRKSMVVERHEVMDNNGPFTWDHNQGIEESLSEITTNAMDNTNFMPRDSQRLNVDMKDTQKMTAKTTKKRRKSMATSMGENIGETSKHTSYDVLLPNPSEAIGEITDRKSTLRPRSKSMYVETPMEPELLDKTAEAMPGDCIIFNPKHFNSQRRILDSSSDEADTIVHTLPLKPVIQNVEIITPPPPVKKKCLPRKRRVVKVLSSSYQADAMETPSSKDQQDFSSTESNEIVTEKSCLSMLNTHPIFNTQVHDDEAEGNLNLNNMTPSLLHDDRFKEIDSTMQDMFNSPQHEPPIGEDQLLNETSSNLNVDEATNSNKENTTNSQDDTTSTTTTTTTHNTSDSTKHVTLGTSEYRFEKVSDNVVNLFISRKRKRKQK
ncbi:uncharacterized protein LOC105262147 [Musca domestica]|uniref:Uncharacterized protein LOC105262147 n=1 Tax=Musca domestica TaxID=7370 RepID=A0A9J7IA04_MUSDO|nr:uncharacterized protein LOC105262147 [Musca domestica]